MGFRSSRKRPSRGIGDDHASPCLERGRRRDGPARFGGVRAPFPAAASRARDHHARHDTGGSFAGVRFREHRDAGNRLAVARGRRVRSGDVRRAVDAHGALEPVHRALPAAPRRAGQRGSSRSRRTRRHSPRCCTRVDSAPARSWDRPCSRPIAGSRAVSTCMTTARPRGARRRGAARPTKSSTARSRWLDSSHGSPFFSWVHLYDAHAPQTLPDAFRRQYPAISTPAVLRSPTRSWRDCSTPCGRRVSRTPPPSLSREITASRSASTARSNTASSSMRARCTFR